MHGDMRLEDGITIEEIDSLPGIEAWQAAEAAVWPGSELEVLPSSILVTLQRYGGLLLGARDRERRMIGILLGFPGIKDGKLVHCSHLLGMVPEWRSHDIGYWMKRRQREYVLEQGLDLVVWTFDPLETRNARLNIGRLGGVCYQYFPNLYGAMTDALNQGMESDRFQLNWHIRHPRVVRRLHGEQPPNVSDLLAAGIPVLTRTSLVHGSAEPFLRLQDVALGGGAPSMLVEAPTNFQAIKRLDSGAARGWREGVRTVMLDLFTRDYAVVDVLRQRGQDAIDRCYYVIGEREAWLRATE